MNRLISFYTLRYTRSLVYMLQSSEYNLGDYFGWFWRVEDFRHVEQRKSLDPTAKARSLLAVARLGYIACYLIWLWLIAMDIVSGSLALGLTIVLWFLIFPYFIAYGIALPLFLGRKLIQEPKERQIISAAQITLAKHPAVKIAIAGSYGKTTMKEILTTVLGAGFDEGEVRATPGNMNTPIGISRFANKLTGNEKVLIFEMGEYYPGDIKTLSEQVQPSIGIMTGINEAHLSKFKTLDRTVATIFELNDYLEGKNCYKNGDNVLIAERASGDPLLYSHSGVDGWNVSDASHAHLTGIEFVLSKGRTHIKAKTALLGEHQIGPIAAAAAIAADHFGLTKEQIEAGIKAIAAFDHRMQISTLSSGATLIDDSYNGNADGVAAGIKFLSGLTKHEIRERYYVTPGLVETGSRTELLHREIGKQLAASKIEHVVLIRTSVTPFIADELDKAGKSEIVSLYDDMPTAIQMLPTFTVPGDVVMIQNDWTDNYA